MNTVAIIEDEPSELSGLRKHVDEWTGFRCAGAYRTAETALQRIPLENPDIVIVDLGLPRMDGIRCIWELKKRQLKCEILVHSIETQPRKVFQAIQAGATGYLIKGATAAELLKAVRDILNGGSPMSPTIARLVTRRLQATQPNRSDGKPLSHREVEVLMLIVKGYRTDEVARELCIAADTVKTHIRHIYEALQVHSRAEVIAWWHEHHGEW